jgi:hypothetical protein
MLTIICSICKSEEKVCECYGFVVYHVFNTTKSINFKYCRNCEEIVDENDHCGCC